MKAKRRKRSQNQKKQTKIITIPKQTNKHKTPTKPQKNKQQQKTSYKSDQVPVIWVQRAAVETLLGGVVPACPRLGEGGCIPLHSTESHSPFWLQTLPRFGDRRPAPPEPNRGLCVTRRRAAGCKSAPNPVPSHAAPSTGGAPGSPGRGPSCGVTPGLWRCGDAPSRPGLPSGDCGSTPGPRGARPVPAGTTGAIAPPSGPGVPLQPYRRCHREPSPVHRVPRC